MAAPGVYSWSPDPFLQFRDELAHPLGTGKLYTYLAGTTTPATTYSDVWLTVPNLNPIILMDDGTNPAGPIFLDPGKAYRYVLQDLDGNTIWTRDNIIGGSVASNSCSGDFITSQVGMITDLDFNNACVIIFTGTGPNNVDIIDLQSLKAGVPGQKVTIINGTEQGFVWLQHMHGPTPANQLFNMATKMATPLGSNGSAVYQYSGWDMRWHLISHDQGFPIPYDVPAQWAGFPPGGTDPQINSGTLTSTILLRQTMLLISINLIWGADTDPGTSLQWFFRTPVPSFGVMETGSGWGLHVAPGAPDYHVIGVTWSPSLPPGPLGFAGGIVGLDAPSGQVIGPGVPFTYAPGDQLRITIEMPIL